MMSDKDRTEICKIWMDPDKGLPKLGFHRDVPDAEYHSAPGLNKSILWKVTDSTPLHMITEKRNPKPTSPIFMLGKQFHALVLEPDTFNNKYCIVDDNAPLRPTAKMLESSNPKPDIQQRINFWDDFDRENEGKVIISTKSDPDKGIWGRSDWDTIHYMRDSLMEDKEAGILMNPSDCITEYSGWYIDKESNRLCKFRDDAWNTAHNLICDLKTTNEASYSAFSRDVFKFGYHMQEAHYAMGHYYLDKVARAFWFILVEKQPPYAVACYQLMPRWREVATRLRETAIEKMGKCLDTGEYPGYGPVRDLDMPAYAEYGKII